MFRARIESGEALVLDEPHASANLLRTLHAGDEVSLADRRPRPDGWTRIERPAPSRGWIQRHAARMHVWRPVLLLDPIVEVRAAPEEQSEILLTLRTGARLALLGPCDAGSEDWIRVELRSCKRGFVPGRTPVEDQDRATWQDVDGTKGGPIAWFLRRGVVGGLSLAGLACAVLFLDIVHDLQQIEVVVFLLMGLLGAVFGMFRGRGGRTDTAWHLAPPPVLKR